MGDDQNGLSRHQLTHGLLNNSFVLGVYVGGRLVQHHNGRVFEHGPGDGDALAFAAGQMGAASAHHGVVAAFQAPDKGVAPGGLCHGLHLGVGGRRATHADIFPDALVKEVVVLGDKGHLVIELLQWDPLQVLSAQGDGAGGYIPKAGDQLGDGGLARARGPHKGGHAPGGNGEGHIVEHLLVRVVAERHMGELDVPAPELHRRFPVILLRPVQDGVHRAHDGAHFGKAVHKVHGGQQRPGNAQGQDDGGDKGLDGQTPSGVEKPAHRQNSNHGGR